VDLLVKVSESGNRDLIFSKLCGILGFLLENKDYSLSHNGSCRLWPGFVLFTEVKSPLLLGPWRNP
jgi:hypothetical protein